MPLDEMLVFARVVEHQSFAGAARQLGLTTSAVSRSVGRLEAHFGLRLLQRTTRSLSLTEAGQRSIRPACGWWRMPRPCRRWPASCASSRADC